MMRLMSLDLVRVFIVEVFLSFISLSFKCHFENTVTIVRLFDWMTVCHLTRQASAIVRRSL